MTTKTAIRLLFKAIRRGELDLVREQTAQDPSLVNVKAITPPKKDDGQSPLQVALKTGNMAIANLLIDRGADVGYMEEDSINEWRAPALHDALRGVVTWAGCRSENYGHLFAEHLAVLRRMLELGADANGMDSYGNTCLGRVILDARIQAETPEAWAADVGADMKLILDALQEHGADPARREHDCESAYEAAEGDPVERLLWR